MTPEEQRSLLLCVRCYIETDFLTNLDRGWTNQADWESYAKIHYPLEYSLLMKYYENTTK